MKNPSGKLSPTYKHGHYVNRKRSPEYETYHGMKARCYNKNKRNYCDYGGRGITICDRWLGEDGFKNFLEDMCPKPSYKCSLDRIDNNKGYSKENCRWATIQEQNRNNRRVWEVCVDGKWLNTVEAAKSLKVPYSSLANAVRGFQKMPKHLSNMEFRRKY